MPNAATELMIEHLEEKERSLKYLLSISLPEQKRGVAKRLLEAQQMLKLLRAKVKGDLR